MLMNIFPLNEDFRFIICVVMTECFSVYLACSATGRPTEIPEKDIYLNEARYDEEEGQFRKLKGLKVHQDRSFDVQHENYEEKQ